MITTPQDTLLGESVAIFCQTNGFPIPSISWQRNGVSIDNSNNRFTIFSFPPNRNTDFASDTYNGSITEIILRNGLDLASFDTRDDLGSVGVLLIPDVIRGDTTTYNCIATNELQQTMRIPFTSEAVSLTVLGKVVQKIQYFCNRMILIFFYCSLERPDPPINVTLINPGPRYIDLRWRPNFDGNRDVQQFLVYRMDVNVSSGFDSVTNFSVGELSAPSNNQFTARIMDQQLILPFTQYSMRVVACNVIGCSNVSQQSDPVQTLQDSKFILLL